MSDETFRIVVSVFAGIAAVSFVLQAAFMWAAYRASRSVRKQVDELMNEVRPALQEGKSMLRDNRETIRHVMETVSTVSATVSRQSHAIEALIEDATLRMRRRLKSVDDGIDTAQEVVRKPARVARGLVAAARAAGTTYLGRNSLPEG